MTIITSYKPAATTFIATQAQPAVLHHDGQACIPSHEQIARRAYEIYTNAGRKQGQCKQNWHEAEEALRDASHVAALERSQNSPMALVT